MGRGNGAHRWRLMLSGVFALLVLGALPSHPRDVQTAFRVVCSPPPPGLTFGAHR